MFVQRGVYDEFLARLTEAAKKLVVGNPSLPETFVGALCSAQHLEKVRDFSTLVPSFSLLLSRSLSVAVTLVCSRSHYATGPVLCEARAGGRR